MTQYLIESNDFKALVTEDGGICTAVSPEFDLCLGLPFAHVRDYCNRKGWFVIPIIPEEAIIRPTLVEIGHVTYSLKWVADILVRVTIQDGFSNRDLSFDEIPESLKNLL